MTSRSETELSSFDSIIPNIAGLVWPATSVHQVFIRGYLYLYQGNANHVYGRVQIYYHCFVILKLSFLLKVLDKIAAIK